MQHKRKEAMPVEPGKVPNLDRELIKQFVPGMLNLATIKERSVALMKVIFERAQGGELNHHPGYGKAEATPVGDPSHNNGASRERIMTDDEMFDVEILRDREGTFKPKSIATGERRFTGFDDKAIATYACGKSVLEMYGTPLFGPERRSDGRRGRLVDRARLADGRMSERAS